MDNRFFSIQPKLAMILAMVIRQILIHQWNK